MARRSKVCRNFNYTQRVRIERRDVVFQAIPDKNPGANGLSVVATIDFRPYAEKLDEEALVVAEVYKKAFYARAELGEVARFLYEEKTDEIEFPKYYVPAEQSRFRLKVITKKTSETDAGLLLGLADNLRLTGVAGPVKGEEERETTQLRDLLPVVFSDLGEVPWRLEFNEDGVRLFLNNKLFNQDKVNDPLYRALLLPCALQTILTKILIIDSFQYNQNEENSDWQAHWIDFVSEKWMGGTAPMAGGKTDDREEWIENAVERFCKMYKFVQICLKRRERGA